MKTLQLLCSFILVSVASTFTTATAQTNITAAPAAVTTNTPAVNTAIIPVPRDANWLKHHEEFLAITKAGGIDILFLGDSITAGWRTKGSNVWNQCYAPRHAANFGISADRTQHVLWRMEHGELDGLKPKVVVLLIGTNNTGIEKDGSPRNRPSEVVEGVSAAIKDLRTRLPQTKILLLAIFPRGTLDNPQRAQVAVINTVLARLDDGKWVRFLNIGPKFLEPDGTLLVNIMPDLLHPNEKGYQIWADAMEPTLAEMLK